MCGIAGFVVGPRCRSFVNNNTAEKLADELLLGILNRGQDATGVVSIGADGLSHQRAACDARVFNRERRPLVANPRAVLLHTRFATQGHEGFVENNHPVVHNGVYVTHNGHISNDATLFRSVPTERLGAVDSEIIPALLSHVGWEAATIAAQLEKLDGGFAIAALNPKSEDVYIARGNSSPLVYIHREGFTMWASERTAMIDAWRKVWGTPPKEKDFIYAKEGQLIQLRDGDVVAIHTFTPIEPAYVTRYTSQAWKKFDDKTPTLAERAQWGWSSKEWDSYLNEREQDAIGAVEAEMADDAEILHCADCGFTSDKVVTEWWEIPGIPDVYCEDCAESLRTQLNIEGMTMVRDDYAEVEVNRWHASR
jgi:asparagine synthetase B (glutamine-hydrolysing)